MNYNNTLDGHVVDIIQNNEIKEQKDLRNILKNLGYDIPQATLSRRLKKLKIAKIDGIYKAINFSQRNMPLVLNLQTSELGMIVMHTHPGQANGLAYFIDRKYVSYSHNEVPATNILGTIAGDDTVLLVIKSCAVLQDVLEAIYKDFPYLKKETS